MSSLRALNIATVLALVAVSLAIFTLTLVAFNSGRDGLDEYDVIGGYILPQPILETRILEGGIVQVGPVVKCNLTDESVTTKGELHFRKIGDGGTVVPGFEGSGMLLPGCYGDSEANPLRFFNNVLPSGVTPGLWIVEGSDVAVSDDGREDVEGWFTQQFEVVPRE